MRIVLKLKTATLPSILLDELMSVIKAQSKTDAVITAIHDEIRMKKQERIKNMAGDMELTMSADRHGDKRFG